MPRKGWRKRPKKFEDKSDPERSRAKTGFTAPLKDENHKVEGKAYVWPMESMKGESLVLAVYHDGEVCVYIEPLTGVDYD